MPHKKNLSLFGFIGIAITAILLFIMQVYRPALIVRFGVIGANNIKTIIPTAIFLISVVFILLGLPSVLNDIKNKRGKKRFEDLEEQFRSKNSGPEKIREQLDLMMHQRTALANKIDQCISQIDEIEQQINSFDRLIKINEAQAFVGSKEALEETQHTICANLKWVINSMIVSDSDEAVNSRISENIDKVIVVNKTLLDKDEEFLLDIADYLSNIKGEGETFQLDAWRETIKNLNQKSLLG